MEFFPKEYPLSFSQFNYYDFIKKVKLTKAIDMSEIGFNNKEYISKFLNEKKIINLFKEGFTK